MESERVGHNWTTNIFTFLTQCGLPWWLSGKDLPANVGDAGSTHWVEKISWRKKWQPTPVFLPGKSHRQRSLAGYSPWGHRRVGHDLVTKQQECNLVRPHRNFPITIAKTVFPNKFTLWCSGRTGFWNLGETLLDSIQCPSFFSFTYCFLPHWVFLAAWAFSSFREQEPLFAAVHHFLPAGVSLAGEHRLQRARASWLGPEGSVAETPWFQCTGSGAVPNGLVALQQVASSWTRDQTHIPCIGKWILYQWVTMEDSDIFL